METSVLKIHVPVRITPCPPRLATLDFVDKGHPDRENDIQESQVLTKSWSYNGTGVLNIRTPVRITPLIVHILLLSWIKPNQEQLLGLNIVEHPVLFLDVAMVAVWKICIRCVFQEWEIFWESAKTEVSLWVRMFVWFEFAGVCCVLYLTVPLPFFWVDTRSPFRSDQYQTQAINLK